MSPNRVKGVAPGFLLLPAREYDWELKNRISIHVPLTGSIRELLGERELDAGVRLMGDDEFSICDGTVIRLWEVVRVLFAEAQYPALEDDESLNVVALEQTESEIILYGEIIRSVS
jgi:DNA-binding transcriptional LysR family regulator